jgi:hypothetical protein
MQQWEIAIINLQMPNVSAHNVIKHISMDLKTQIDHSTVVVGDLNTSLSPVDGSYRQKNHTEILELNDTMDLMDLPDIYSIFHPAIAQ